jgi:rare lipoprotein A
MRIRLAHGLALALSVVSLGAAQGPSKSGPVSSRVVYPARVASGKKNVVKKPYQVGTASWYGQDFVGKPTASGEPYDMYDMTAAHPTLPLGTYVRVTNLGNGRAVVVRINDRGPVVDGRIIDVSYNAARALNFKDRGIQRVRLDVMPQAQIVAMVQPLAN